ncbi:hypothetical protein Acr_09g0007880 [Actinidia rufa]|uniref:Tetratricopeptide repeat (TPR)-like superfamily protein n=1 Tax=Actinidia rufa TaxID=165716 RepID=A0A7J0F6K0_9ERIC|nr:hypothetical protein Acr_09g0007880 [Actinidia rufa]
MSLPFLFNNLVTLYAKCGHINRSLKLFSKTHGESKNVITWTSLITQLSHHKKPLQALEFFNQMRSTAVYPNQFTFSAILPACADTVIVHGEQNKLYDGAVGFFRKIIRERLGPNQVSFSSVLSACANTGMLDTGKQIHGAAVKQGLITLAYVKNSLMDMYSKCGIFGDAVKLFQTIGDRDVVTWNVMVMGWVQNDNFEKACNYFWVMRREGVSPDEASFSTVLHAAANLAALDQGTLIHDQIIKTGE